MNGYSCKEEIIQNLKDAGCNEDVIQSFMDKLQSGKYLQGIQLLQKHRCGLLDNLHKEQSQIDCLDYLLFMIKKQNKDFVCERT